MKSKPPDLSTGRNTKLYADKKGPEDLAKVVNNGYCVGCGACAAASNGRIKMKLTEFGTYVASVEESEGWQSAPTSVCPFSDAGLNETEHAEQLFDAAQQKDKHLGHYLSTYAGHANAGDYRENGSSGGITSWILDELLRKKRIDYVVHVRAREADEKTDLLFKYDVSSTHEKIFERAKSRYYPVEASQVINQIKNNAGRYAFVGVPCFVKALRNVALLDPVVRDRVAFTISLFCGHLKSGKFAESLAWQLGVSPTEIESVNFRHKLSGRAANAYGFSVISRINGEQTIRPMTDLLGKDWGIGLLKLKSCDFCDDLVGETADISIGDAWITPYLKESQGTNLIVVRNHELDQILKDGGASGSLNLEPLAPAEVVKSQLSGFWHRREGLQYRLFLADKMGLWRPRKRMNASQNHISKLERLIFLFRQLLRDKSHAYYFKARAERKLELYTKPMRRWIFLYHVALKLRHLHKKYIKATSHNSKHPR